MIEWTSGGVIRTRFQVYRPTLSTLLLDGNYNGVSSKFQLTFSISMVSTTSALSSIVDQQTSVNPAGLISPSCSRALWLLRCTTQIYSIFGLRQRWTTSHLKQICRCFKFRYLSSREAVERRDVIIWISNIIHNKLKCRVVFTPCIL